MKETEGAPRRTILFTARRPFRRALRWFQERDDVFRDLMNLVVALATVYVALQANTIAKNQSSLMETQNTLLQREQLPLFDLALIDDDGSQPAKVVVYSVRGAVSQVQVTATVDIPVCLTASEAGTPVAAHDPGMAELDSCQMLVLTDVFGSAIYDRTDSGEVARAATVRPLADLRSATTDVGANLDAHPVTAASALTLLDPVIAVDLRYIDAAGRPQASSFQIATDGSERVIETSGAAESTDALSSATSLTGDIGVTVDSEGNPRQYLRHTVPTTEFTADAIRGWWLRDVAPIVP